ncbi:ROK family protein [Mucilaginibacter limnophilus]|uniref:ROK family protein n=1 Tax=Mucilaginibacter limnophilus TaxID=1932778 RepID=UPI0013E3A749|nr:ROK family protein [Mucilaginibacter limnophilus]
MDFEAFFQGVQGLQVYNSYKTFITAKCVAEAAFKGEEAAIEVYRITAQFLGHALAIFIDMLNPELIILGSIYDRTRELIQPVMMR